MNFKGITILKGIDHGTPIWEIARNANHANSSSVYDNFIGNGAKHRENSTIVRKRINCLRGQTGENNEEPSQWVVENLFEPGILGEKRFLELVAIDTSYYYRCTFNQYFRVGVTPDGQIEHDGNLIPLEIKTNCRDGKRWDVPLLKTHVQNMFQCLVLKSSHGAIVRVEENTKDYMDFTIWVMEYDMVKFVQFFENLIEEVEKDQRFSADQTVLKECIRYIGHMPNQCYLMDQECHLVEQIKHLLG